MFELRLYLLGEPRIETEKQVITLPTRHKHRWLGMLAYLAVEDRAIRRDEIADVIWDDSDEVSSSKRDMLRKQTIPQIKEYVGQDCIDTESIPGSLIFPEQHLLDVRQFNELYDKSSALDFDDVEELQPLLERAFGLYQGDFLGKYTLNQKFDAWKVKHSLALSERFEHIAEQLIKLCFDSQDVEAAYRYAQSWSERNAESMQADGWVVCLGHQIDKAERSNRHHAMIELKNKKYAKQWHEWQRCLGEIRQEMQVAGDSPSGSQQLSFTLLRGMKPNHRFRKTMQNFIASLARFADVKQRLGQLEDMSKRISRLDKTMQRLSEVYLHPARLWVYRDLGITQKALELLDEMNTIDPEALDADEFSKALWYHNRGLIFCWIKGDYKQGLTEFLLARGAQALRRSSEKDDAIAGINIDIGLVYWTQGDFPAAERHFHKSKDYFTETHNRQRLLYAVSSIGIVNLNQGKTHESLPFLQEHVNLAKEFSNARELRRAVGNRGIAKLHVGDYEGAIQDLWASIETGEIVTGIDIHRRINISRLHRAMGKVGEAFALAEDNLRQVKASGYWGLETLAQRALAECLPPEYAVAMFHDTLEKARGKRRFDEAACLLGLAHLSPTKDERDGYRQHGVQLLEKMGATAWLEHDPLMLPIL
jgi:DNA-binding SARP family transcriptional activator